MPDQPRPAGFTEPPYYADCALGCKVSPRNLAQHLPLCGTDVPARTMPEDPTERAQQFATRYPDPVLQQLEDPRSLDISVNDAFVMGAWGKQAQTEGKVTMLADGNGEFVKALGLTMGRPGS